MSFSGTVGRTVVSVQELIDDGARAAGKFAEELTAEQVASAKRQLFYLLSSLINRGIQYWAIDTTVIGLQPNQYKYDLPAGAVDALNVLYRTMNRTSPNSTGAYSSSSGTASYAFDSDTSTVTQQTAPNGNIAVNFGSSNSVYAGSIGILPGTSGSFHIVLEYSTDGSSWTTLLDCGATTWVDNSWLWYDVDPGQNVQYYRMRETGGGTLAVREFYVGNNSREIQMSRLNRDDYSNLPNKNFTANQPYQFYFERALPVPRLVLWPTPNTAFVQVTAWYSRQVMDVGDLSGQLEIPDRWYLAIGNMLSHRMALTLPAVPLDRVKYLEDQASRTFTDAEQEERDKSPIYWAPDISPYTR